MKKFIQETRRDRIHRREAIETVEREDEEEGRSL
jgi:hypothetical protein